MTVSTTNNKDSFTGTGANTPLPTTFPFIDDSDLEVIKRVTATGVETTLTLSTHYTVTGGSYATGTVTPVDGATDFPSSVTWTIKRKTPLTQSTDYVENDSFGAETHENALDKATYLIQDAQEEVDRALKVAVTDSDPGVIPGSVERASSYLGFDAAGDPVALSAPADTAIVTTYIETLLDDIDAATARATLEAQEDVITTRGDLVRGSAVGTAQRLARGTDGQYLKCDGSTALWSTLLTDVQAVQKLPRSYLAGLEVTRTSATEFNVNVGVARCGTSSDQNRGDAVNSNAAFGKLFDNGGWDAGDGGGGVPAACGFATAIDTWHYFIIVDRDDPTNIDFGWDTDVDCSNLIADAAVEAAIGANGYFRRIISVPSTATPDFADFTQIGDEVLLAVPVLDYNDVTDDITSAETVTLASVPDGVKVKALIRYCHLGTADWAVVIRSAAETDAAPNPVASPGGSLIPPTSTNYAGGDMEVWTDTSQQIYMRKQADATTDNYIITRGWIDRRGRDD